MKMEMEKIKKFLCNHGSCLFGNDCNELYTCQVELENCIEKQIELNIIEIKKKKLRIMKLTLLLKGVFKEKMLK